MYFINSLLFNKRAITKIVVREENILKGMLFLLQILPCSDTSVATWEHFYMTALFTYKLK